MKYKFLLLFVVLSLNVNAGVLQITASQLPEKHFQLFGISNQLINAKALLFEDKLDEYGSIQLEIDSSDFILFEIDFGWRQFNFYWNGLDTAKVNIDSLENYYDFTMPMLGHVKSQGHYDSIFSVTDYFITTELNRIYSDTSFLQNSELIIDSLSNAVYLGKDSLVWLNFEYALKSMRKVSNRQWINLSNQAPLNFELPALAKWHDGASKHFGGKWYVRNRELIKNVVKNGEGFELLDTLSVSKYDPLAIDKLHTYILLNLRKWKYELEITSSDLVMYTDYLKTQFKTNQDFVDFVDEYEEVYCREDKIHELKVDTSTLVHLPELGIEHKYVYIMSWSSWSRVSVEELVVLDRMQERFANSVVFIAVNIDEDSNSKAVQEIVDEHPNLIFDFWGDDLNLLQKLGWIGGSPPTCLLLDYKGQILINPAKSVLEMLNKFDDLEDAYMQQQIDLMQQRRN